MTCRCLDTRPAPSAQLVQKRALSLGEKLLFLPALLVLQLVAKRVLLVHVDSFR